MNTIYFHYNYSSLPSQLIPCLPYSALKFLSSSAIIIIVIYTHAYMYSMCMYVYMYPVLGPVTVVHMYLSVGIATLVWVTYEGTYLKKIDSSSLSSHERPI